MTEIPYTLLPTPEPTLLTPSSKHPLSSTTTELSSSTLLSRILSLSDEFFASASCLLQPSPPLSLKGQFGPKGALYDGWETRRHNAPDSDWVVIGLGPEKSRIHGFEVDTRWFTGNEGPAVSVFGILLEGEEREKEGEVDGDDSRWQPLLPIVPLQPAHQHFYTIPPTTAAYSHILLRMHPDGGIGRFRVYGIPSPPSTASTTAITTTGLPPSIIALSTRIDLASALNGGRTTSCSDQHFANASNLLVPTRGVDMGDGWETRRSRDLGHKEWAVVRLCGDGGRVEYVEVDSAFHMGNFPKYASVEAIHWDEDVAPEGDEAWTTIVPKSIMGPHRQHFFPVDPEAVKDVTHVRVSIYPDGGLKRIRVWGHQSSTPVPILQSSVPTIEALPLTYETFLPYGRVIQGYSTPTAAPKGVVKTTANQGTAAKYHKMAPVLDNYAPGEARTSIRTVRADAQVNTGSEFDIKIMERHMHSTQTFIAMGKTSGEMGGSIEDDGAAYISVVALPGPDGQPDLTTLRAFLVPTHQAVSYAIGVWHHPLLTVNKTVEYAVIEANPVGSGRVETEYWTPSTPVRKLLIPELPSKPKQKRSNRSLPVINGKSSNALSGLSAFASKVLSGGPTSANIPCVALTSESFAKFGQVIQAYGSQSEAPNGIEVEVDEQFKVTTTYAVAPVESSYKPEWKATTAVSCFRSTPKEGMEKGRPWPVHFLERHPYTEQAFVPMGMSSWRGKTEEPLAEGAAYIVICAEAGADGKPDPSTIQAFFCTADQGVNYSAGVWHHPMLTVGGTIDLACVEAQTTKKSDPKDCELLEFDEPLAIVDIPSF